MLHTNTLVTRFEVRIMRIKDDVELFNAQDIAYEYRGVKQRYDGNRL